MSLHGRYNMGICYSYTGELDKSLSCFSRSLEIRPDYHDALQWKVRLSTRIADESAAARGAPADAPESTSDDASTSWATQAAHAEDDDAGDGDHGGKLKSAVAGGVVA